MYRSYHAHPFHLSALALGLSVLTFNAWACGVLIYEAGQEGCGLANAGVAALASDPSLFMSNPAERKYKDTRHASIGTQYQAPSTLHWSRSVGYDSPAVEDKYRTVDNPMGEVWRLATGVNDTVDEGLDAHAAYALLWLGDMDVEQIKSRSGDTVSGSYRNPALHIMDGGTTWRF